MASGEEVAHGGDLRDWSERAKRDATLGLLWMMRYKTLDSSIGERSAGGPGNCGGGRGVRELKLSAMLPIPISTLRGRRPAVTLGRRLVWPATWMDGRTAP